MSSFRFKQFTVLHEKSSIKVGVDGVLLGAWAAEATRNERNHVLKTLDVGCGCGLIALMMAQAFPEVQIDAVDIHHDSILEAQENFRRSPWSTRLRAIECDIKDFIEKEPNGPKYDIIVSNPPFFNSGLTDKNTPREKARHQDTLSPISLLGFSSRLLKAGGSLFMILPTEQLEDLKSKTIFSGMTFRKICLVKGSPQKCAKRVMVCFQKALHTGCQDNHEDEIEFENLDLRLPNGDYTNRYRKLTSPYYLNF